LSHAGSEVALGQPVGAVLDPELTLGGYLAKHERAPAFGGSDGQAYSVAIWVDDEPDERGRFGASLLFVRWSPDGERPLGTVESPALAWGKTAEEAESRVKAFSLYDVKEALDTAIRARPEDW